MGEYIGQPRKLVAHKLDHDNATHVAFLCGGLLVEERNPETDERFPGVNVPTMKGMKRLMFGDYLVQDPHSGAWGIVPADIFEESYTAVGE